MIGYKEISSWKIVSEWSNHKLKIEGHGSMFSPYTKDEISGSLVSLTNERGKVKYLFIADEPVIDYDLMGGNGYVFHEGVFENENADGRCWFLSSADYRENTIITNSGGVFTKCDYHKGLVV